MLTVRVIGPDLTEHVYQVYRVEYQIDERRQPDSARLLFLLPDGSTDRLDHGRCYVMNDMGKTVAKYELGDQSMFLGNIAA